MIDVRLLGGLAATAPGRPLLARALWFAMGALVAMAFTGFLLFAAEASHVMLNPVFQLKLAIPLGAGLVNVGLYEFGAKREVEGLPPGATMPAHAPDRGRRLACWCGSRSPPVGGASRISRSAAALRAGACRSPANRRRRCTAECRPDPREVRTPQTRTLHCSGHRAAGARNESACLREIIEGFCMGLIR